MAKVFYIVDGNGIVDLMLGGRMQAETSLDFIRNKNDNDYLAYDIVELETGDELEDGLNEVVVVLKNSIPFKACINNYDKAFEFENTYKDNTEDDLKKYTMETIFVPYSVRSNVMKGMIAQSYGEM